MLVRVLFSLSFAANEYIAYVRNEDRNGGLIAADELDMVYGIADLQGSF